MQGSTYTQTYIWIAGDPLLPVDLTGATIKTEIRAKVADDDSAVLLTASTTDGKIIITDATGGEFAITIPASETALSAQIPKNNSGVHDIDITLASGAKSTPIAGAVSFVRQVTV